VINVVTVVTTNSFILKFLGLVSVESKSSQSLASDEGILILLKIELAKMNAAKFRL